MKAALVRVAIHTRHNGEANGVPEKLTLQLADKASSPYYIVFTSFIVDKVYFDALEFMHIFKEQEDAMKRLMKTGVAEFTFQGYNKFTIEDKEIIDEIYTRMGLAAKTKQLELKAKELGNGK